MHILHLVQLYRPVPSGASRYFEEMGERLVRAGHRVTVVATNAFDLEHLWSAGRRTIAKHHDEHNGVRVVRYPIQRLPASPLLYPVMRRLMVELSRLPMPRQALVPVLRRLATLTPRMPAMAHALHYNPDLAAVDLVHSTNITLDFAILPVLQWAEQRHIPHICTPFVHLGTPGSHYISRYYSLPQQIDILRRSAAVITQTDIERHFLHSKGVDNARMHTIGVGVTPSNIAGGDAAGFRQTHTISGPIVLTIGVAAYDKGTPHVVEAMQRLWSQGSNATWVQIGPLMTHFEQWVKTHATAEQSRMRILGFVDDQTRCDALAAADVFVLPSRTDSFGIVYLEAWVYGVPVIGAYAGGVLEVIEHGADGLLVPFGDVPELTRAIQRLLQDHTLAQAMGRVGHAKVLRRYTWEHIYAQVREVYMRVANERAVVS